MTNDHVQNVTEIGQDASQADMDLIKGDMPNVLICIGCIGSQMCYLNTPLEDARNRFRSEFHGGGEQADPDEYTTWVLPFGDSFPAYEVG